MAAFEASLNSSFLSASLGAWTPEQTSPRKSSEVAHNLANPCSADHHAEHLPAAQEVSSGFETWRAVKSFTVVIPEC